ncbi:MAG: hypothetical protein GX647_09425 [Clostridiales bacterium]|nr:hypothetical protein [Clostridiales bacterium]
MNNPSKNLKMVLEYLGITNLALAKALDIDPSVISRYLTGKRRLLAASPQMDAIAEYILARAQRVSDVEWLKDKFRAVGLPTDISTVFRFKQNLIMWLATDGETLRRNLGPSLPGDIAGAQRPAPTQREAAHLSDGDVLLGSLLIVLALRPQLSALQSGAVVDIFLSSDQLRIMQNEDVSQLLTEMIALNDLRFRMVVCVSGNTQAMSKLLDAYMPSLVSGHMQLSVVHGMTQTVTNTMHLLIPNSYAMLVTETAGTTAPPIGTVVRQVDFIAEAEQSFETAWRYAQPVLNIYGDDFSRSILEILYREFCTPGALDVVKDSVNPMFMSPEAYDRFLRTRGHSKEEFAWRSAEFLRFKSGMDGVLCEGMVYREILSLPRLNDIALTGRCRMAGLYFMERGYIDLDAEGCAAILSGYIEYLQTVPSYHMLILDDLSLLHQNNCWHLKQNQSLGINYWQDKEPVMLHSDQLLLLREFQTHFDRLWARGEGYIGNRSNVVSILMDVLERLKMITRDANSRR